MSVYQNFEIEAEKRDELIPFLAERNVRALKQWGGVMVHSNPALGFEELSLPRTEEVLAKGLMIPLYPELSDEQVRYVAACIREFYAAR